MVAQWLVLLSPSENLDGQSSCTCVSFLAQTKNMIVKFTSYSTCSKMLMCAFVCESGMSLYGSLVIGWLPVQDAPFLLLSVICSSLVGPSNIKMDKWHRHWTDTSPVHDCV